MTLLMAAYAADGAATVSDRKETLPGGAGREVAKYHLDADGGVYLSLAGDGWLARRVLGHLAGAGKGGPAGAAAGLREIAAYLHERHRARGRVDGILITAGPPGPKIHDVYIRGGHADIDASGAGTSMHGDDAAVFVCRHLARDLGINGLPCGEAAAYLHVLASTAGELVASVGERGAFGLDLGTFPKGRRPRVQRHAGELGRLEVRLHAGRAGPGEGGGGAGGVHHG